MEDEAPWFIRGLGLNCTCTLKPFWEETFQWPWDYLVRSDNTTQSSCIFVFAKKVLNFIGPRNVRSYVNKVIDISYVRIQGYFSIPGFRWGSYTHANLGGVTSVCFHVGYSSSLKLPGKVIIPVSKYKRDLVENIRVDVGGKRYEDTSMDK